MSPIMRLALPVLAVAGSAYAACTATATVTIQNSGDASAIATCSTFKGDIAIQTDAPGPIAINGVRKLDGSLFVADNEPLQQIGADSLEEISGTFEIRNALAVNTLSFPKLKAVRALRFINVPKLQNLGFDAEVERAELINIENTELQSLQGLNIEEVGTMIVANNRYISQIAMQLGNVSDQLIISSNSADLQVEFTNMLWAMNMTYTSCASVSLPSLERLNSSLSMFGNSFQSFSAPNLTEVAGALSIVNCPELTNVSFPALVEVGENLELANNTKLEEINQFPQLERIGGALDFNGNIMKIDLPKLDDVQGAFNLQSTGQVQEACDTYFQGLKDRDAIQGEFVCVGEVENPGGEGTDPNSNGGSKDKKGAASSLTVQGGALFVGLAAAFFL